MNVVNPEEGSDPEFAALVPEVHDREDRRRG